MLNLCCLVSKIWLLLRLALQWAEERAEGSDPVLLQPVPGAGFLSAGGDRSRCGQGQHLSPANFGCLLNSLRAAAGPAGGPACAPATPGPLSSLPGWGVQDYCSARTPLIKIFWTLKRHLYRSVRDLIPFSFGQRESFLHINERWGISKHCLASLVLLNS